MTSHLTESKDVKQRGVRTSQGKDRSPGSGCDFTFSILQAGELSIMEADAILLAEFTIHERRVEQISVRGPRAYDKDMIRMGQIFNRTADLVWECFTVCGLANFLVSLTFEPRELAPEGQCMS